MAETRAIPTLPAEFEGAPVAWQRWALAPTLTHIPPGCYTCDHEGPMSMTFGLCESAGAKRRLLAVRCRRCQETRVSTFQRYPSARVVKGRPVFGEQVEVAYFPPQPFGEDL